MLNNVYNMVQQYDSQFLDERLFKIMESLQHVNTKNNVMQEAPS